MGLSGGTLTGGRSGACGGSGRDHAEAESAAPHERWRHRRARHLGCVCEGRIENKKKSRFEIKKSFVEF